VPGVIAIWLGIGGTTWGVSLEDCVAEALRGNPDIEETAHRVAEARAAAEQAKAAYYPLLYTEAGYARTDNAPQAFMMTLNQRSLDFEQDFNNPDDTDNLRLTLGLKYLVTDGGRRSLAHQMARAGGDAAAAQRRAAANELIHAVTEGYYGVLQAHALVRVQEDRLRSLEESLRVARERFDAGSAVRTDVLNLEVRRAQAHEDLIRAGHATELAVAALNTSIGTPLVRGQDAAALEGAPKAAVPPADESVRVEDHPALMARRADTRAAEMARSRSRRAYAPSVYLFGTADWDSGLDEGFEDSYFAGISAEWDLFTGFSRGASERGSQARLRAARSRETSVRNRLELALTQARLASVDAKERLEVTAKSVESAEEALRITQERYQQGAADISELLTAQFGLTDTQTRNVTAQYDYLVALSNLERARGSLLDTYAQHLPPAEP
jgi:outer membrane protein TolC